MRLVAILSVVALLSGCGSADEQKSGPYKSDSFKNAPTKASGRDLSSMQPPPPPATTIAPPPKPAPTYTKGGADYDSATVIEIDPAKPTKFSAQLAGNSVAQFFKFQGREGSAVVIGGTCRDKLDFALHAADRAPLTDQFTEAGSLSWLPSMGEKSPTYYLRAWGTMNYEYIVEFEIQLLDNADAGSGHDAAEGFDKALELTKDSFDGWLAGAQGYRGNDHVDTYKLKVSKGKTIKARVTPPTKLGVEASWHDKDGGRVALEGSKSEGAAVTVEWTPEYDGEAYLRIAGELQVGGQYKVEIQR